MTQVRSLEAFAAHLRERIPATVNVGNSAVPWNTDGVPEWTEFNELALELFHLQFEKNRAYRHLCESRGIWPNTVRDWNEIPAVPTSAFKECELSCIPREERTAMFFSSGTTEHKPSRHFHHQASLEVYEASLTGWYRLTVGRHLRAGMTGLALVPGPAAAPHSSLVHMFETLRRNQGFFDFYFTGIADENRGWAVNFQQSLQVLERAQVSQVPVLLLGTAFSYVHLLDFLSQQKRTIRMPEGSLVIETGGYKGRSRELPKSELHSLICRGLGVQRSQIICEYGMSELSSQAYDLGKADPATDASSNAPIRRYFCFPPWARLRIVSPETGKRVSQGETGLIQVFDLANIYSVMAVQTDDLGVRASRGFELLGRAALAEPRGCSLMSSA